MINLAVDNYDLNDVEDNTYVTITLADEVYGISVNKVQEVIGIGEISRVPNTLDFFRGVINLRGEIIPLIDLRLKFDVEQLSDEKQSVVIVTEIEDKLIGLVVDAVSDVINITEELIQHTAHFSANIDADCIEGIIEINDKIIILVDVNKLFTEEELEEIKNSGKEQ